MKKIDVKNGDMTYAQRIALGKILSDQTIEDVARFDGVFLCLHDKQPKPKEYESLFPYFNEIVDGIIFWTQTEEMMLHYVPTEDEIRAGIKEYQTNVGDLGTATSIAKDYGFKPEDVFNWKYSEVFAIMLADLEAHKYKQRMSALK